MTLDYPTDRLTASAEASLALWKELRPDDVISVSADEIVQRAMTVIGAGFHGDELSGTDLYAGVFYPGSEGAFKARPPRRLNFASGLKPQEGNVSGWRFFLTDLAEHSGFRTAVLSEGDLKNYREQFARFGVDHLPIEAYMTVHATQPGEPLHQRGAISLVQRSLGDLALARCLDSGGAKMMDLPDLENQLSPPQRRYGVQPFYVARPTRVEAL